MKLRKLYKAITSHTWEIGFLDNSLEEIVKGEQMKFISVKSPFKDRWFADPFILEVSDDEIVLLCEEFCSKINKGRIAKLVIDRKSYSIKSWNLILELPTHLSFPIIYRSGNNIYIYPENSENGVLNLYEYILVSSEVRFVKQITLMPCTDAVALNLPKGDRYIFTTFRDNPNGNILSVLKYDNQDNTYRTYQKIVFEEKIARMAGDFFYVNDKLYRPSQICDVCYGHGLDIQEVNLHSEKFELNSVRKIYSPHKKLRLGIHTFNTYKGIIVVDVKGYKYILIASILEKIRLCISKLKNII